MEIIWDPIKQEKLKKERGIDLDEIKGLIENEQFFEILEHKSRQGQYLIPLEYKSYVHIVVIKTEPGRMILKTCYPSRWFHKKYKGTRK